MPDLLDRLKTALADRYRIEREIGAGGMATVYLAEDLKHQRKVHVRLLRWLSKPHLLLHRRLQSDTLRT